MAERSKAAVLKTDFPTIRKPHNFKQILLLASGLGCLPSSRCFHRIFFFLTGELCQKCVTCPFRAAVRHVSQVRRGSSLFRLPSA